MHNNCVMANIQHPSNPDHLIERLRAHRYFNALAEAELRWLASRATCYRFAADEVIFLDGESSAGMWIVHEGHVKVYKTSLQGDEHIVHFVGPGESFNDVSVLDGGPNPASAAALTPVMACHFTRDTIVEAIHAYPALAMSLIQSLAARTRFLVDQVEDLALHSVTTRVARFLVKQQEDPTFNAAAPVSRGTLASHLAIKPETLSRALGALENAGAIAVSRTSLTIQNGDLLRVVALL